MAEPEKIFKAGITREEGWLYFIDKKGNIARSRMMRTGSDRGATELLMKTEINKDNGWLYFVDKDGDIARVQMIGSVSSSDEHEKPQQVSAKPTKAGAKLGKKSTKHSGKKSFAPKSKKKTLKKKR